MKVEIKSVLIGLLLGINIMLLMGTAPAPVASGKYQISGDASSYVVFDTQRGVVVRAGKAPNSRRLEERSYNIKY